MQARSPSKPVKQSKSREFMRLPNKLLFISTFFNQKIQNQHQQTYAHLSHLLPASPSHRRERNDPNHFTPKYEVNNNKIHFNFDQMAKPNRNFRKVTKHRSLNRENSRAKEELIEQRMNVEKGKRLAVFLGDNDSFVIDTKKSALLGEQHHQIIKKQLQDKFQRTRLNFKEETRTNQIQDISKMLDRRHRLLKKITKSEEMGKHINETERFQPWMRSKLTKNGTFDLQQSANYEEQFRFLPNHLSS